jgi:hypothetical protein
MAEVTDFLDQVINQDFASAAPTFNDIMGDMVNQSLEQEKVKMANQVFNGVDPEERADQDQYELDLDDPNIDDEDELDDAAEEALDMEDDEEDDSESDEEEQ